MEFLFLFDLLGKRLFVGLKVIVKKILFPKGLSLDFLFVFKYLIDGRSFRIRGLVKFVHKNIVILIFYYNQKQLRMTNYNKFVHQNNLSFAIIY